MNLEDRRISEKPGICRVKGLGEECHTKSILMIYWRAGVEAEIFQKGLFNVSPLHPSTINICIASKYIDRIGDFDYAMNGGTSVTSTHTDQANEDDDNGSGAGSNHYRDPFDPPTDYSNDPEWHRLRAEFEAMRAFHGKDPPWFPDDTDSSTELPVFPLTPDRSPPPPLRRPQLRSPLHQPRTLPESTSMSSEEAPTIQRDWGTSIASALNTSPAASSPKQIRWQRHRPTTRFRRVGIFFSLGNTSNNIVKQSGKRRTQLSRAHLAKTLGSFSITIEE